MDFTKPFKYAIGGIPFRYKNVFTDTEWGWEKRDGVLHLSFCGSNSRLDWAQNFSFWMVPYKRMPQKWKAHAGFVLKWRSIRDDVLKVCDMSDCDSISIYGYSQGGALAILANEDIKFHYPTKSISTFAFGAPRVVWGKLHGKTADRFGNIILIQNGGDIVPGLPPRWLGYRHWGCVARIGKKRLFRLSVKDHLIPEYQKNVGG